MIVKKINVDWHPGLSIYASEPFLKLVGDEYGWLGGFYEADNLRCILPYTIIRKAIFRLVRFRVETIPLNGELSPDEEKAFLNGVVAYFRKNGADMIMPATTNTIFQSYPDGAIAAPYGTFIIDLTQSEDALWSKLHSKHRNVIRNAMKKGVEIKEGPEQAHVAHELIRDTLKRSKLGFMGYKEYEELVHTLNNHIKIFVAYFDGVAQGSAVIPYSDYSAYYLYGGSIPKPLTGAMNFLQWEAIRMFRDLGVRRYDFVGVRINPADGSKQEGLMMYKQRFGGRLVQGYLWKYPLRPSGYFIYSQAVKWMRNGDIVDQERQRL